MEPIPQDMLDLAASFDDAYPPLPIADRPFRLRLWLAHTEQTPEGAQPRPSAVTDFHQRIAVMRANGVPVEVNPSGTSAHAWFPTLQAARDFAPPPGDSRDAAWFSVDGPEDDRDPREHRTLVAEYIMPDGRRRLGAWPSTDLGVDGVRYNFLDGNWACDCNRVLDIDRTGGGIETEVECDHSIKVRRIILRRRNRATGAVIMELAVAPGEDGEVDSFGDPHPDVGRFA